MKLHYAFILALGGLLAIRVDCPAATYTITEIRTVNGFATQTHPSAINNNGHIVGVAYSGANNSFPYHAFLYSNGSIQDLQTLGGTNSAATGINQSGQIVGYSDLPDSGGNPGPTQAFLYDGAGMQSLGSLVAGGTSHGSGINNFGQAVGDSLAAGVSNNIPTKNVFLFSGGTMHDLGNLDSPGTRATAPWDINDTGQIAGTYFLADNRNHAFIYASGVLQDLGTLGGSNSNAVAINNGGQATGSADLGGGISHAFLFDGTMHDLGSLGTGNSNAKGLNNIGHVVGSSVVSGTTHAFLSAGGLMLDLNTLIAPNSGWVLNSANAINDHGEITGTGIFDGQPRAYLLTPVPEPSSFVLGALGLIGFAAWGRRQKQG